MNDLPIEKAGDGSSLSMLARFGAAAAGVALLGSVFASVYSGDVETATTHLSSTQATTVEQSIEGAADVAATLPQAEARALTTAADDAFDSGAQVAFGFAAALAALAAIAAIRALRPKPPDPAVS